MIQSIATLRDHQSTQGFKSVKDTLTPKNTNSLLMNGPDVPAHDELRAEKKREQERKQNILRFMDSLATADGEAEKRGESTGAYNELGLPALNSLVRFEDKNRLNVAGITKPKQGVLPENRGIAHGVDWQKARSRAEAHRQAGQADYESTLRQLEQQNRSRQEHYDLAIKYISQGEVQLAAAHLDAAGLNPDGTPKEESLPAAEPQPEPQPAPVPEPSIDVEPARPWQPPLPQQAPESIAPADATRVPEIAAEYISEYMLPPAISPEESEKISASYADQPAFIPADADNTQVPRSAEEAGEPVTARERQLLDIEKQLATLNPQYSQADRDKQEDLVKQWRAAQKEHLSGYTGDPAQLNRWLTETTNDMLYRTGEQQQSSRQEHFYRVLFDTFRDLVYPLAGRQVHREHKTIPNPHVLEEVRKALEGTPAPEQPAPGVATGKPRPNMEIQEIRNNGY